MHETPAPVCGAKFSARFRPQQHHLSSQPDPITKSMPIRFALKTASSSTQNLSDWLNSTSDSLNRFAYAAQGPQ
ncbi:hypothetical protein G7Z17_g12187 [Cylindrodendrum hubeiense]|uniref:Uncharacterized protein n=1 Tax=Cylindrodendrum hubeiense TaxID=595255 RepID=A0A9P5GVW4_9HYPO|nr:hypothetical protein G7Z17_g12187 [Cylindrodendrum hubeiense]